MSTYLYEVASRLIGFDTVSSKSNVEAMEYLGTHLDDHGFRVSRQRTEVAGVPKVNLVACAGPAEPDGLIISGHIDTEPVRRSEEHTSELQSRPHLVWRLLLVKKRLMLATDTPP